MVQPVTGRTEGRSGKNKRVKGEDFSTIDLYEGETVVEKEMEGLT